MLFILSFVCLCFLFFFFVLLCCCVFFFFFFSSRRRHTRCLSDWSSDVCSSDLPVPRSSTGSRSPERGTGRGSAPSPCDTCFRPGCELARSSAPPLCPECQRFAEPQIRRGWGPFHRSRPWRACLSRRRKPGCWPGCCYRQGLSAHPHS